MVYVLKCGHGRSYQFPHLMASGNWALVTRKDEICFAWSNSINLLISGYMMGSPTRESAQWRGIMPSWKRSGITPGTPEMGQKWCKIQRNSLILIMHFFCFYAYYRITATQSHKFRHCCEVLFHFLTMITINVIFWYEAGPTQQTFYQLGGYFPVANLVIFTG